VFQTATKIPPTTKELFEHQKRGIGIALREPRWGFWWEPGCGKTRLIVEAMKEIGGRCLIVAPLSILSSVWEEELFQSAQELKVINLWNVKKRDRKEACLVGDVVLANYETFRIHEKDLDPRSFKTLVIDESSKLKDKGSKISKAALRFGKQVERCYLLSGTPAPNSELEYFPQIDLLSPGLLGFSYWSFRNVYFRPTGYMGYQWKLKTEMRQGLINKLKSG